MVSIDGNYFDEFERLHEIEKEITEIKENKNDVKSIEIENCEFSMKNLDSLLVNSNFVLELKLVSTQVVA